MTDRGRRGVKRRRCLCITRGKWEGVRDLPSNINRKRTRLTSLYGEIPADVTLVPSISTPKTSPMSWPTTATGPSGPRSSSGRRFTQYLTEAGIRKTFDFLAVAAPGRRLMFT
jgi:O-methyltransferase involved in polyketide biosynthesis